MDDYDDESDEYEVIQAPERQLHEQGQKIYELTTENEHLRDIVIDLLAACELLLDAALDTEASGVPAAALDRAIGMGRTVIARARGG